MNGQQNENNLANLFQLILKGPAYSWFTTLAGEIKPDCKQLVDAFKDRFVDNTTHIRCMQEQQLLSRQMQHDERLEDYVFDMDNLCSILNKVTMIALLILSEVFNRHSNLVSFRSSLCHGKMPFKQPV